MYSSESIPLGASNKKPKAKSAEEKVLLLCNYYPGIASTIIDHIDAFQKHSKYIVHPINIFGNVSRALCLSDYDVIVLHYSLVISSDAYLATDLKQRIRNFNGVKCLFIQDEYRWIYRTIATCRYLNIDCIFSVADKKSLQQIYPKELLPTTRLESVLTGYVDTEMLTEDVTPYADRLLDIGYRARKVPAWLGSHALQKWEIAEKFKQDAISYQLNYDISTKEQDRIYGEEWIQFLKSCKAVLGTESGASVCDFTGEIQEKSEKHLRQYPEVSFEELKKLYFKDVDNKIIIRAISPRVFEAAALRVLMVLYEGEYSGIIKPWQHYIPLAKDHSNIEQVINVINTPEKAQEIIDTAYQEIALNPLYHFKAMIKQFDHVVFEELRKKQRVKKEPARHSLSPLLSKLHLRLNSHPISTFYGLLIKRLKNLKQKPTSFFFKYLTGAKIWIGNYHSAKKLIGKLDKYIHYGLIKIYCYELSDNTDTPSVALVAQFYDTAPNKSRGRLLTSGEIKIKAQNRALSNLHFICDEFVMHFFEKENPLTTKEKEKIALEWLAYKFPRVFYINLKRLLSAQSAQ